MSVAGLPPFTIAAALFMFGTADLN